MPGSRASPCFAVLAWLLCLQLRILPGGIPVSGLSSLSVPGPFQSFPKGRRVPPAVPVTHSPQTEPRFEFISPQPRGWVGALVLPRLPIHLLCVSYSLSKGAFCFFFLPFFFLIKYFRAFLFFPLKKTNQPTNRPNKIVFCKTCLQVLLLLKTLGEILIPGTQMRFVLIWWDEDE